MILRFRLVARLLAVAVVSSTALFLPQPAMAVTVPETMADRRPVQAGPVETAFPIDHLGVIWNTPDHFDVHAHDDAGPEPRGAVRFRTDGRWGPWIPLTEDGAEGDGQWASGLVAGGDADAYQVRGIPAGARSPRAVVINTTDGPEVTVGERRAGAASALDSATCRSRADWGADESVRDWDPEFYDVQTLTVHHTATANDDPDPEATVRAIYRYHAVDLGWGDIGYQYLVDEEGVVYEGRWSGTDSTSCETEGGDGSDFGHEVDTDAMVTGAHTGGYNSGNMGVALLGEFTDHPRSGGDPTPAAVGSLEDVLTELGTRHALDPTGTVDYVNPVNGDTKTVDTISGHRDWNATECPGERLYAQLPTIRDNVKAAMEGSGDTTDAAPMNVAVTSPSAESTVTGVITVTATADDDSGVATVEFFVDGESIGSDATADTIDGTWSVQWDSTSVLDGSSTLTATATDDAFQSTTSTGVVVTVQNDLDDPTTLSVTGITPTAIGTGATEMTLIGTGFTSGTTVSFENGKGLTPTVNVTSVTATSVIAVVTVGARGPDSSWDVRVTLADGSSATAPQQVFVDR